MTFSPWKSTWISGLVDCGLWTSVIKAIPTHISNILQANVITQLFQLHLISIPSIIQCFFVQNWDVTMLWWQQQLEPHIKTRALYPLGRIICIAQAFVGLLHPLCIQKMQWNGWYIYIKIQRNHFMYMWSLVILSMHTTKHIGWSLL